MVPPISPEDALKYQNDIVIPGLIELNGMNDTEQYFLRMLVHRLRINPHATIAGLATTFATLNELLYGDNVNIDPKEHINKQPMAYEQKHTGDFGLKPENYNPNSGFTFKSSIKSIMDENNPVNQDSHQ